MIARFNFCACALAISSLLPCVITARADDALTYRDLTRRMSDMEQLAVLPASGEVGGEASSYDRHSKYDAATDKYIDWDANADGGGYIRREGDQIVMADLKGPGCIWRMWSAGADVGNVRIYIDGSKTPAVEMPFEHFFKNGPFTKWGNLACYGLSPKVWEPGCDTYIPIPFQKSCKITGLQTDQQDHPEWGRYYQFHYVRYPEGTKMPAFQWPLTADESAALDEANEVMGKCGEDPAGARAGQQTDSVEVTAKPGESTTVAELTGAGAVTGLKVKLTDIPHIERIQWTDGSGAVTETPMPVPSDAEAQRALLRQLTIRITWDGQKSPAVWSPLGDFFGFLGGAQPYKSLPAGVEDDGTFYCYWYMPFASGAKIEVGNDSLLPVKMSWQVTHAPLDRPIAELGRFHAKWHRNAFLPERKDRWPDWTLLSTQGTGRYVGTVLHVWNPLGGWWGEGDDKFFVDGEKFPSYFGTGSEDYFGYGWGAPYFFERPFHAQPLNQSNYGHIVDLRWHIADTVPFQKTFEGCIEKYDPDTGGVVPLRRYALYAAEAFWYLSADGTDAYGEVPVDQRVGYWTPPRPCYQEPGAIEAEWMTAVPYDWQSEQPHIEGAWDGSPPIKWSNDKQLVWTADRAPGIDRLQLKFHTDKAGKYRVIGRFTKAPGYGIFQFGIDSGKIGAPVDLYNTDRIAADPTELGTADLAAGDHLFTVALAGKNAALPAEQHPGLGIDYLKFTPVQ